MLVELGCSVSCAADADEAAAALTGGGIDAMLLDVELPGGGGAEPLAARLGDPGGPALVGITGSGETTLPPASRPAEILVKPFSDSDLREAIQRALARRSTA
jgi:CheY-like chemotaxis protein